MSRSVSTPPHNPLTRAESVHSVNGHPEPFLGASSPAFGSTENISTTESVANGNAPQTQVKIV